MSDKLFPLNPRGKSAPGRSKSRQLRVPRPPSHVNFNTDQELDLLEPSFDEGESPRFRAEALDEVAALDSAEGELNFEDNR